MKNLVLLVVILLTAHSYASSGIAPAYPVHSLQQFNQNIGHVGWAPGHYLKPKPYYFYKRPYRNYRAPAVVQPEMITLDSWRRINPNPTYIYDEPRYTIMPVNPPPGQPEFIELSNPQPGFSR